MKRGLCFEPMSSIPKSVSAGQPGAALSVSRFDRIVDRFGATASFLCAVHCALLPLVFGVLPALGLAFLANHAIERAFVAFAIVLATTSLLFGLRRHGSYRAFWVLIPGIVLLVAGMFVGLDHSNILHAVLVTSAARWWRSRTSSTCVSITYTAPIAGTDTPRCHCVTGPLLPSISAYPARSAPHASPSSP